MSVLGRCVGLLRFAPLSFLYVSCRTRCMRANVEIRESDHWRRANVADRMPAGISRSSQKDDMRSYHGSM